MSDPLDPSSAPPVPAPAPPSAGSEEEAWAEVVARWEDEGAHRAYLVRLPDLEGLGVAGRRYRAVLAERPQDAMAQRMRAVVLKRATALGLASLPRSPVKVESPRFRKVKLALFLSLGSALVYLLYAIIQQLPLLLGSKP